VSAPVLDEVAAVVCVVVVVVVAGLDEVSDSVHGEADFVAAEVVGDGVVAVEDGVEDEEKFGSDENETFFSAGFVEFWTCRQC